MRTRSRAALVGVGLLVGGFAGMFFSGWGGSAATAQQPAAKVADAVGRYQISSFGFGTVGGGHVSGGYILDTATGDVFLVSGSDKPLPIGSMAKK
jgi:hypothetical protein